MSELQKIRTDFKDINDFVNFINRNMFLYIYQPSDDIICIEYHDVFLDNLFNRSIAPLWLKPDKEGEKELADRDYYQKNPTLYRGFIPSELFDISFFVLNGEKEIRSVKLKEDFDFIEYIESLSIFSSFRMNDNFISKEAPNEYDIVLCLDRHRKFDFQSEPLVSYEAFKIFHEYGYDYFKKCDDIPELRKSEGGFSDESSHWAQELDYSDIEGDPDLAEDWLDEHVPENHLHDAYEANYIFDYENDQINFYAANNFDIYKNYYSILPHYDWNNRSQCATPIADMIKDDDILKKYFDFLRDGVDEYFKWEKWRMKEIKKILDKRPPKDEEPW